VKKLVLVGGVAGVGKSTLLRHIKEKFGDRILKFVDPGELFRRHIYKSKRPKKVEEVEEMIVNEIVNTPNNAVIVCHWHYAVSRPDGYILQIRF